MKNTRPCKNLPDPDDTLATSFLIIINKHPRYLAMAIRPMAETMRPFQTAS